MTFSTASDSFIFPPSGFRLAIGIVFPSADSQNPLSVRWSRLLLKLHRGITRADRIPKIRRTPSQKVQQQRKDKKTETFQPTREPLNRGHGCPDASLVSWFDPGHRRT